MGYSLHMTMGLLRLTGAVATTVSSLRDGIRSAEPAALLAHLHGGWYREPAVGPGRMNDFAIWVWRQLGARPLAERLSSVDPTHVCDLEEARAELLEILEDPEVHDPVRHPETAVRGGFYFLALDTLTVPTGREVGRLQELRSEMAGAPVSVLFHHVILAPLRRGRPGNDMADWVRGMGGHERVAQGIERIPAFLEDARGLRARLASCIEEAIHDG